jgi:hypothetical protein
MEVSGQLHDPDALPLGKEPPVLTGQGAVCCPRAGLDAGAKRKKIPSLFLNEISEHMLRGVVKISKNILPGSNILFSFLCAVDRLTCYHVPGLAEKCLNSTSCHWLSRYSLTCYLQVPMNVFNSTATRLFPFQ